MSLQSIVTVFELFFRDPGTGGGGQVSFQMRLLPWLGFLCFFRRLCVASGSFYGNDIF
jgi:hypothetical protein